MKYKLNERSAAYIENEINANRHMTFALAFTALLLFFVLFGYIFKVFDVAYSTYVMTIHIIPIVVVILCVPLFLIKSDYLSKPYYKYVLLFQFILGISILNIIMPKHAILGWAVCIVLTSHYYSPKVTRIVFVTVMVMMTICIGAGMFFGIFVFILAETVFSLFSLHEETVSHLVFLFKLFAFILPFWGIKYFYVSYFQGVGLRKLSTIFSVFGELIFAVLPTWLFSRFLGINGIWIGLAATEVLAVLMIFIFAIIHNKRLPKSIEGMLFLPEYFKDEEVSMLDLSAQNIKGMEGIHYLLEQFCMENEIDENRTMAIRLSVEELSSYLLMNYHKKRGHLIDVQLRYCRQEDDVILNFRYNDPSFNPTTIYDSNEGDHDEKMKNIGLRLIYQMSKDIRYVHFVSYAELLVEL